jgi:hypothetical protein
VSRTLQPGTRIVTPDGQPTLDFRKAFQDLDRALKYEVAGLPSDALVGQIAYATDLRVFNGAGTKESAGNGTGGLVSFNGSNWVIVGTNVTASA